MIFVYYFVATSGSAVEPNCRICLAWPAGRWSDPFHWLDCFIFQQAKPSNHVYFWFFEEEVVWPHYLECWSFFDRFRHAERSKQWNQGELPISPFFCLAASLEGRQIQTNQWKVVWPSDPSVKKLQCLIPLPSDSQKCNWEGGQGDPKNHQLGLFFIQRWFDDFSYAACPPTVLVGLCVCAILFFGRRFYLRWYCLRWRWSDPFNHCFTKRKYLFWMDLLMDLP